MKKTKFVLDSYALIAYLENENGAETVQKILEKSEAGAYQILLSVINWGEVYYSIYRTKGEKSASDCLDIIDQLPIKLVIADKKQVYASAKIKSAYAVAYGDCFATALVLQNSCQVITGDKEFRKLGSLVNVLWI